jgi:cytidylate kinase
MTNRIIAIDGPSASGKSTVARAVARNLRETFLYVDSGSLYRAVTWQLLQDGVDTADASAVGDAVERIEMAFVVEDGAVRLRLAGRALTNELRTTEVSEQVSPVSAVPAVRCRVVAWLRNMASLGNLVMEGRDIGTAVFPETPYKFYLDASAEARAARRKGDTKDAARGQDLGAIKRALSERDRIDRTRKTDPLRVAEGATVIDSTNMSPAEVAETIYRFVEGVPSDRESSP